MRLRAAVAALMTAVALSACGVPLSDAPEAIPGALPPATTPAPATTAVETGEVVTLWFIDGVRLVPATLQAPAGGGPADVLAGLGQPPGDELRTLMTDPLGGPDLATLPAPPEPAPSGEDRPAAQTVVLSPTFAELAAEDQVRLIGQVVLSLTEIDRRPVSFVDGSGAPLSVPLPDGRLRDGSVTRGDYLALT